MRTNFLLLFVFFCLNAHAQLITTIAGTGTLGFSGDGGPATAANTQGAYYVSVDTLNGEVWVADQMNHRIRKIDLDRNISTIAGTGVAAISGDGGPAIAAELSWPTCMIRTSNGNTYISQQYHIRRIDPVGIITTIAGNGTLGYSGDGGMATNAAIDPDWGLTADNAGNVYFSNQTNHVVRKISPVGIITTVAGNGTFGFSGDGGPATNAQFKRPSGLTLDTVGNLFIVDGGNFRIRKMNTSGILSTFVGGTFGYAGDGGAATLASFHTLDQIAFDEVGNLYITDFGSQTVRRIDTSGIINTISGTGLGGFSSDGGPATAAQLKNPTGITVLGNGILYIPDVGNKRIRVIDQPPVFTGTHSYTLTICSDTPYIALDTMLTALDSNTVQLIRWNTALAPVHGTLLASDTLRANAGVLVPSGLTYTPPSTYIGMDSFRVKVTDGIFSDSIIVYVNILDCSTGLTPIASNGTHLTIFPNPTTDGAFTCTLTAPPTAPAHITLTDVTGRVIKELTTTTNKPTPILINTAAGVYFVHVRSDMGTYVRRVSITE